MWKAVKVTLALFVEPCNGSKAPVKQQSAPSDDALPVGLCKASVALVSKSSRATNSGRDERGRPRAVPQPTFLATSKGGVEAKEVVQPTRHTEDTKRGKANQSKETVECNRCFIDYELTLENFTKQQIHKPNRFCRDCGKEMAEEKRRRVDLG